MGSTPGTSAIANNGGNVSTRSTSPSLHRPVVSPYFPSSTTAKSLGGAAVTTIATVKRTSLPQAGAGVSRTRLNGIGGSAEAAAMITGEPESNPVATFEDENYDDEESKLKKKQFVNSTAVLVPAREILEQAFEGRGKLLAMDMPSSDPRYKKNGVIKPKKTFEALLSSSEETKKLSSTPTALLKMDESPVDDIPAVPKLKYKLQPQFSGDAEQLIKTARETALAAGACVTRLVPVNNVQSAPTSSKSLASSSIPLKPALKGVLKASLSTDKRNVHETPAATEGDESLSLDAKIVEDESMTDNVMNVLPNPLLFGNVDGGDDSVNVSSVASESKKSVGFAPDPSASTSLPASKSSSEVPPFQVDSADDPVSPRASEASPSLMSPIMLGLVAQATQRTSKPAIPENVKEALYPTSTFPQVVEALLSTTPAISHLFSSDMGDCNSDENQQQRFNWSLNEIMLESCSSQTERAMVEEGIHFGSQTEVFSAISNETQTDVLQAIPISTQTSITQTSIFSKEYNLLVEAGTQTYLDVLVAECEEINDDYYEDEKTGIIIYNGPIDKYVGLPLSSVMSLIVSSKPGETSVMCRDIVENIVQCAADKLEKTVADDSLHAVLQDILAAKSMLEEMDKKPLILASAADHDERSERETQTCMKISTQLDAESQTFPSDATDDTAMSAMLARKVKLLEAQLLATESEKAYEAKRRRDAEKKLEAVSRELLQTIVDNQFE